MKHCHIELYDKDLRDGFFFSEYVAFKLKTAFAVDLEVERLKNAHTFQYAQQAMRWQSNILQSIHFICVFFF